MVIYQLLHVAEDLGVAPMGGGGHGLEDGIAADGGRGGGGVGGCGLGVQDEGDGEEAFDPFDQLVAAVGLQGVFDAVAGRHSGILRGGEG